MVTVDKPERPEPERSALVTWPAVTGFTVIVMLSGGWFAMSRWVMGHPAGDAFGEALGVALALLVVVSVIGAVRGRSRSRDPG
jgi:hypothetical protein